LSFALEQRHEALDSGNRIRSGRSRIKAELKALDERGARERLAEIIEAEIPRALGGMYAFELVMLAPRVGDSNVRKILGRAGVHPLRRAHLLTARQRGGLARELRKFGSRG
jgi:hypothetical protein